MKQLLLLLCFVYSLKSAKLPSNFPICKNIASELPTCFSQAVEKALQILKDPIPKLGISSVEPLEIESLTFEGGNGSVVLNQYLKNVKIYNLTTAKVLKSDITLSDVSFNTVFTAHVPVLKLTADYNITGHILFIPIAADGKYTMSIEELDVVITMIGQHIDKKGTTYIKLTNATATLAPTHVVSHIDTLFRENQQIGDDFNRILNENWKEVFAEFKEAYEEVLTKYLHNLAENIFNNVPLNDLFPKP